MSEERAFVLSGLVSKCDLHCVRTTPVIAEQLRPQSAQASPSYRYEVNFDIVEGRGCPALDLDNYTKPILDAITRTQLVWRDDRQIDVQVVRRRRDTSRDGTEITVCVRRLEGQHGGVPSFFRAHCYRASRGGTYRDAGYHLAMHVWNQQPYDLDEEAWEARIEELNALLEDDNRTGVWEWFCRHFPKSMHLVPNRRMDQFVSGVVQAYDDGRMAD